jgi:PAS domain S-box-containing protein
MGEGLDYIKNCNALFVEDDYDTRGSLVSILEKFFNKVIVSTDGEDGYDKYSKSIKNGEDIHIIISDINMPIKNGLDMLADIRKTDFTIPCIFLTAHNEAEYMLEAIKLGISRYVLKPINIPDLIQSIEEVFEKEYNQLKIGALSIPTKKFRQYIDVIDHIVLISETDTKGIITYVNDSFCEISGYSKEELIGQPHSIIRHPDMPKELFENIWYTIKSGNSWRGKIKNKTKDDESYYVDAHISPIYKDDHTTLKGYLAIRFLTTEIETEKRIFKHKVIQSIIQYKSSLAIYENSISELNNQINTLREKINQSENPNFFYEQLNNEKKKIQVLKQKVAEYSKTIKYLKEQLQLHSIVNVKELEHTIKNRDNIIYSLKKRLEMYQHKYDILQQNLYNKDTTITELNKMLKFYQQHYNHK